MSNKATEFFTAIPRQHNCAQAVAAGLDRDDLVQELSVCGGGRAPQGYCGALHAALLIAKPEHAEQIKKEFSETAGALTCREIKGCTGYPCAECVRLAAELAEKYR